MQEQNRCKPTMWEFHCAILKSELNVKRSDSKIMQYIVTCYVSFLLSQVFYMGTLLHCAEPAVPTHSGSLYPPTATGLAHPHCYEIGAADVYEKVYLKPTGHLSLLSTLPLPTSSHLPKEGHQSFSWPCICITLTCISLCWGYFLLWWSLHIWCPLM